MIYPKHNRFYKHFFDFYTKRIISSDFSKFEIIGDVSNLEDKPLLVIANHFSWWDGFFIYHLNNLVFKKRYHVMMLEEQLSKRLFLTKLGVFGVKKGSRDSVKSLRFSIELLKQKENMVLIFPQGKIESHHTNNFVFERGIEKIRDRSSDFNIVMVASLVDYFSERQPIVMNYLSQIVNDGEELQVLYNRFFQECLEKQNKLS